jgi:hypothetical protein
MLDFEVFENRPGGSGEFVSCAFGTSIYKNIPIKRHILLAFLTLSFESLP